MMDSSKEFELNINNRKLKNLMRNNIDCYEFDEFAYSLRFNVFKRAL